MLIICLAEKYFIQSSTLNNNEIDSKKFNFSLGMAESCKTVALT